MKRAKFSMPAMVAIFAVSPFAYGCATDSVSIMEIAMTGMPVPGTGGTFTSFGAPTTDRDVDHETGLDPFWFIATSSNGNSGVYVYDAVYNNFADLADTTMAVPTGGNFASFSNLTSGEGVVGFVGTDSNGASGVYGIGDIPLTLIATPSTGTVSGTALGNIQSISMTGNPYGTPAGVIQTENGIYIFIVGSPPPLLENLNYESLTSLGSVSFKGSIGNSNIPGIYQQAFAFAANAGSVRSIYYTGPYSGNGEIILSSVGGLIPDGAGIFTSFGNPYVTANEVAFTAHYTTTGSDDQQGIFIYGNYLNYPQNPGQDASLKQIVASGQIAPNSNGATFTGFSDLSDSSFDTTFLASLSDGNEGLYVNVTESTVYSPGPQLIKVVETGDLLDGKIVDSIALAPDASNYFDSLTIRPTAENVGIGFEVDFTDGSEALEYFTINLPEPATLGIFAVPLLLPLRRRGRK